MRVNWGKESLTVKKKRRNRIKSTEQRKYNKHKSFLLERDGRYCSICEYYMVDSDISIDHVVPMCAGGTHDPLNLRLTCKPCNALKSVQDQKLRDESILRKFRNDGEKLKNESND